MSDDQVPRIGPLLSIVRPPRVPPEAEESVVAELRRLLAMAERGDLVGLSYVAQTACGDPMTALAGEFLDPFVGIGALELLKTEICKTILTGCREPTGGDDGVA